MAFIDIKDPIKREEIVQDYIRNIKEIRARKENEKVRDISQRQDLAKVFQPVVQATEKSTSQITKELKNLKEEPESTNQFVENYFKRFGNRSTDQYFGIYKENGVYRMGSKQVEIDDSNNIRIDNGADIFKGTAGLWELIMVKTPTQFTSEDFEEYKRLVEKTEVIHYPNTKTRSNRPTKTAKWNFFKETGLVEEESEGEMSDNEQAEEVSDNEEKVKSSGSGIQFLPSDINGLIEKLHLLVAERRAGNKSSTRNQIVAILDELLRVNYLNQEEYNAACEWLSC